MLAVQKYSIVKSFENYGIDPALLIFSDFSSLELSYNNFLASLIISLKEKIVKGYRIKLVGYPYYFEIIFRQESSFLKEYKVELNFSPGVQKIYNQKVLEFNHHNKKYNWNSIYEYVELWAKLTANEIASMTYIDKVTNQINKIQKGLNLDEDNIVDEFSQEEKTIFVYKIEQLKSGIETTLNLDDYKLNLVLNKLDELKVKIDSQNKFDFKSSLYGLMINLSSSVIYDKSSDFINLFRSIFNSNLLK